MLLGASRGWPSNGKYRCYIEGIAWGCVFLNPKYTGNQTSILQREDKPTNRKVFLHILLLIVSGLPCSIISNYFLLLLFPEQLQNFTLLSFKFSNNATEYSFFKDDQSDTVFGR